MTPLNWRKSLGLTQAQAAEALGISRRHYIRLEHDWRPSKPLRLAMAAVKAGLKPI